MNGKGLLMRNLLKPFLLLTLLIFISCEGQKSEVQSKEIATASEAANVIPKQKITATSADPAVIYFKYEYEKGNEKIDCVYKVNSDGTGFGKAFDFKWPEWGIVFSPDRKYVPFVEFVYDEMGQLTKRVFKIWSNTGVQVLLENDGKAESSYHFVGWVSNNELVYWDNRGAYVLNINTLKQVDFPTSNPRLHITKNGQVYKLLSDRLAKLSKDFKEASSVKLPAKSYAGKRAYLSKNGKVFGYYNSNHDYVVIDLNGNFVLKDIEKSGIKTSPLGYAQIGPNGNWIYYFGFEKVKPKQYFIQIKRSRVDELSNSEIITSNFVDKVTSAEKISYKYITVVEK